MLVIAFKQAWQYIVQLKVLGNEQISWSADDKNTLNILKNLFIFTSC